MVMCAVFGCQSNNTKLKDREAKISFFRFPKEKQLRNAWLFKCARSDKFNIETARVCSLHFKEEDFERNLRDELLNSVNKIKKLKRNIIPSEHLPSKKPLKQCDISRQKRQRIRHEKQIIHDAIGVNNENTAVFNDRNEPMSTSTDYIASETFVEDPCITNTGNESCEIREIKRALLGKTEENIQLLEEIKKLKMENEKLTLENQGIENIFSDGQRQRLRNKNKKNFWNANDIASAISLHSAGARAYRWLLKNNFPYPAESTLRRWASKISIEPGVLSVVFKLMKDICLTKFQRVCIILADEMKIKQVYEYNKKTDTIFGPANYVQVVMARGLFHNWKQPIFFKYDYQLKSNMLCFLIKKLEEIDFNVVAVVSDMAPGNRKMWKLLEVSEEQPYFENPHDKSKKIYVFPDTPHLIKLIRNHFLDSGFKVDDKNITKGPIVELLDNMSKSDLKIAPKISNIHLHVAGPGRQKVKLATQLFSHTNSRAIVRLASLGIIKSENWLECADLIKKVNDWFDVFNSKVAEIDSRHRCKAYGLEKDIQDRIINDMKLLFANLRVGERVTLLPFQKGIIMAINALPMLFDDLKRNYNIKYLLTYRLNQDPLEGFFSIIRAIGGLHDHPTPLEFKYRLRNYLLGRNQVIVSQSTNVQEEMQDEPILQSCLDDNQVQSANENCTITSNLLEQLNFEEIEYETDDFNEMQNITGPDNTATLTELEYDGLENIAGFISYKLRHIDNSFGVPTASSSSDSSEFTWTNHLSEGGLYKATESLKKYIYELEQIFITYNANCALKVGPNYIKNLLKHSSNINVSDDVKKLFFRCRMFFRIRAENSKLNVSIKTRKRKISKTIT